MNQDDWDTWKRKASELQKKMVFLGPTIGAPSEYAGHTYFVIAFKRGVICGMDPDLHFMPPWYTGEGTREAFRRGWRVGRHRISHSKTQDATASTGCTAEQTKKSRLVVNPKDDRGA